MTGTSVFLQLFVGFLLSVAGSSCPVTISPPKVVVKHGDSISINCTADAEHDGMGWEASQGGIGRTMVNHLTWSVANLTDASMKVMCFINPLSDEQCHKAAGIVLYTIPEKVQIVSNSSNGTMEEGEDYYMICDLHNVAPVENLTVMWYKDNIRFHLEKFDKSINTLPNASKIYFTPTKEHNGVQFRCEAHLDLTPEGPYINVSSQTFQIDVKFGPDVDCSTIEIAEGETLDSKCLILGNPSPYVKWLKKGEEIDSSVPLKREDAGSYRVNAEGYKNSIIEKEVLVRVLYGPELSCPDIYTALEDTSIDLTCKVRGYPEPEVTLYKDGEVVRNLENITRNDAGYYTVVASTENQSVNHTFEIIVYYPPSQIFEHEDSEFTIGSSVSLKCSATGNPRPEYYWTYFNTTNISEESDDGVSRLVIHNATTYNIGSYTCLASNKHGNVSKTARLSMEGAEQECPLHISPERIVLEYNSERKSATCKALTTSTNVIEIFWQDNRGIKNSSLEWVADTRNWDPRPVCNGTFKGIGPCHKTLDIILYKQPDSVSVSIEGGHTSLKEDNIYTLVCEITGVAPAKNVRVRWFQGNESFTPPRNKAHVSCNRCNINETKSNVNMWFSTNITVNRTHNGVEFSCEAALDLPENTPTFPTVSRPLNITVHYPPTINKTKLSNTVPVFSGYAEDLKCEADGNPRPEIRWISEVDLPPQRSDGVLSVTQEGKYTCNATNHYGSDYHRVEVIEKTDYLPLIAGFVAVTVVAISVIFVFIYSIYYKNTKMRRYNLKNPKLSTHDGNVAHNGWDMQFPMTKLS